MVIERLSVCACSCVCVRTYKGATSRLKSRKDLVKYTEEKLLVGDLGGPIIYCETPHRG